MFNYDSGTCLNIDDAQIYFTEIGNKNKPPLLMMHGGFQTLQDISSLIDLLSNDFHIIGMDSRGHGKSSLGSAPLTYALIQNDAEILLKHLGFNNINILGFSDGGIVGLRMAAHKAIAVSKLIAIGAAWNILELAEAEKIYRKVTPASAEITFADYHARYEKTNPKPDFSKFTIATLNLWLDKEATGYPNESITKIEAQTLLIRGDNDFLTSLMGTATLATMMQNATFLNVPFAKHIVHEDQKTICEMVIKQFLGCSKF